MIEMLHHPTAIISKKARIGQNVKIGAFTIIEDDVEIGDNTEIRSNVVLANGARIGKDCRICNGAVIATEPQDLKFKNEPTVAIVGDRTVIREYVTINRGTTNTGQASVGSDCLIMTYSHIAHDCHVGNNVIMSNVTQLAGHVTIEDWVITGGVVKVHQFCKIGCHCMIGADVKIVKDVAPFLLVGTNPPKVDGVNKIGLSRRGFSSELIKEIDEFYRILFRSKYNTSSGISKFKERASIAPEIQHSIEFIESSERGVYR